MPPEKTTRPTPDARSSTGHTGEDIAARYLASKGCTVLARNWRANPGEIDIIAQCPIANNSPHTATGPEMTLAFIEVRTRHGRSGLAEESISRRKASSMLAAAYSYMAAHDINPDITPWRIDLVAVAVSPDGMRSINWVQGALDEGMV